MGDEVLQFSDSGLGETGCAKRSVLYDSFDVETSDALLGDKPMVGWPKGVELIQKTRARLEDMPWCMPGGPPVVSDRLRRLLERRDPDAAEYLPVAISGRKRNAPGEPYWVMHILRDVDCMDRQRSRFTEYVDGDRVVCEYGFRGLVIDTSRIPPSVALCRVVGVPETLLMRASCRAECDAAGITGIQYEMVEQV